MPKSFSYGMPGSWKESASRTLEPLFKDGRQPTKQELYDAYPFGMREYTPYKVWLEQIDWFKRGCPGYRRQQVEPLPGQEALL